MAIGITWVKMSNGSRGLYSSEFKAYFNRLPIIGMHFNSVRAIDELPRTLGLRQFIIVNEQERKFEGSHWVVIFRSHKDCLEIFNSLGYKNISKLRPYLKFNFKATIIYNNTAVQKSTSSSCGLYSIYFAIFRLLNLDQSFEEILDEIFVSDLETNENKVSRFCQHLLTVSDESNLFDYE